MDGIEAELSRLRAARRTAEEHIEQERGNSDRIQGRLSEVISSLRDNFHGNLELSLADFGNLLRTNPTLGMKSVYFDGSHVMIPTDQKMYHCSADKSELPS